MLIYTEMEKGFTVFVDGLPKNMNSNWLGNIFKSIGEIVDVYISFKKRKFSDSTFGFVRFRRERDAIRAISSFDGMVFQSKHLRVKWAKHRKFTNGFQPHRDSYTPLNVRLSNGFQSFNDSSSQLNNHIKNLLNDCLEENLGSFKKELLGHLQESILCTLQPLFDKYSKEVCNSVLVTLNEGNTNQSKGMTSQESTVIEILNNDGDEGYRPSKNEEICSKVPDDLEEMNQNLVEEKDKDSVEMKSDSESYLDIEEELKNPHIESCSCAQYRFKEKKKKKKRNRNILRTQKQKRNLIDDCFFHYERWWSEEELEGVDYTEDEGPGKTYSNKIKGPAIDESENESLNEDVEIDKNVVLELCDSKNHLHSRVKNKAFPYSKKFAYPRSLFTIRPRFLKLALGVCRSSRLKFCRKSTVKYVIDNPPNSRAPLVLKPT